LGLDQQRLLAILPNLLHSHSHLPKSTSILAIELTFLQFGHLDLFSLWLFCVVHILDIAATSAYLLSQSAIIIRLLVAYLLYMLPFSSRLITRILGFFSR